MRARTAREPAGVAPDDAPGPTTTATARSPSPQTMTSVAVLVIAAALVVGGGVAGALVGLRDGRGDRRCWAAGTPQIGRDADDAGDARESGMGSMMGGHGRNFLPGRPVHPLTLSGRSGVLPGDRLRRAGRPLPVRGRHPARTATSPASAGARRCSATSRSSTVSCGPTVAGRSTPRAAPCAWTSRSSCARFSPEGHPSTGSTTRSWLGTAASPRRRPRDPEGGHDDVCAGMKDRRRPARRANPSRIGIMASAAVFAVALVGRVAPSLARDASPPTRRRATEHGHRPAAHRRDQRDGLPRGDDSRFGVGDRRSSRPGGHRRELGPRPCAAQRCGPPDVGAAQHRRRNDHARHAAGRGAAGLLPGALRLSTTTLAPGGEATLTFELSMHEGMDGYHDMGVYVPVTGPDGGETLVPSA